MVTGEYRISLHDNLSSMLCTIDLFTTTYVVGDFQTLLIETRVQRNKLKGISVEDNRYIGFSKMIHVRVV